MTGDGSVSTLIDECIVIMLRFVHGHCAQVKGLRGRLTRLDHVHQTRQFQFTYSRIIILENEVDYP